MKDTTIVTIDTTQGEIKARALKHKEVKQIVAITRENPQDADERLEKIMAGCVVEGADKLDDLEEHESCTTPSRRRAWRTREKTDGAPPRGRVGGIRQGPRGVRRKGRDGLPFLP